MSEQVQNKPFAKIFEHPLHGQVLLNLVAAQEGAQLVTTFVVEDVMLQTIGAIPEDASPQAVFDNAAADEEKIFKMVEMAAESFLATAAEMQESEQVAKSLQ